MEPEMIASWYETSSLVLLSQYKLENKYNADKFRLFYQCLPNKTFHLKSEKCSGGKHSKIRISRVAPANAVYDKIPILVIGRSKKPRYLKNVNHLRLDTGHSGKVGWTTFYLKNGFKY